MERAIALTVGPFNGYGEVGGRVLGSQVFQHLLEPVYVPVEQMELSFSHILGFDDHRVRVPGRTERDFLDSYLVDERPMYVVFAEF